MKIKLKETNNQKLAYLTTVTILMFSLACNKCPDDSSIRRVVVYKAPIADGLDAELAESDDFVRIIVGTKDYSSNSFVRSYCRAEDSDKDGQIDIVQTMSYDDSRIGKICTKEYTTKIEQFLLEQLK